MLLDRLELWLPWPGPSCVSQTTGPADDDFASATAQSYPSSFERSVPICEITNSNVEHRAGFTGTNYLGVSLRSAASCTDFVVADLSIVDLVGRPHAAGGFVICLANTR